LFQQGKRQAKLREGVDEGLKRALRAMREEHDRLRREGQWLRERIAEEKKLLSE
jgi:hypothetical protein